MVQLISQEKLVSQALKPTEFLNRNVQTVTKSGVLINHKMYAFLLMQLPLLPIYSVITPFNSVTAKR